ncbi:uncharacterized protein si:ch211-171b20.3 [Erpetoichthys calabaricus]|uniref:uncharacterized protein si:ch211-171b20.3 n=1 Tax=Erpetoichthys calabaricus TaxID=27687 RepID=UPI0010A04D4E|nr:uncharacterized protein si:ch211-171b20.3 [Erpetoichthys calabaricus]
MATPKLLTFTRVADAPPCSWGMLESLGGVGHQIHRFNVKMYEEKPAGAGKPSGINARRKNLPVLRLHERSQQKDITYSQVDCFIEGSTFTSLAAKDERKVRRPGFDQTNADCFPERHSMFEHIWRKRELEHQCENRVSGVHSEERSLSKNIGMVISAFEHQPYKPKEIPRLTLHRQIMDEASKPFAFSSYNGCDLASLPDILLPPCHSVFDDRFDMAEAKLKSRWKMNNRTCSLFSVAGVQKPHVYADPLSGASASFIQRLSEIASLECDTVRQERAKKQKKTKKMEV